MLSLWIWLLSHQSGTSNVNFNTLWMTHKHVYGMKWKTSNSGLTGKIYSQIKFGTNKCSQTNNKIGIQKTKLAEK